ncbi:MAG: succinate dehydrogenase, cytochrome b556 subunit [Gammaproteobacteria bacterium]|nr:succinate dehydrogenase, cytochrome b556 subunit [Gammaproteobacteria bacterium]
MRKSDRPVFLNLFRIQLPFAGVTSIVHRVTGVLWVLLLPVATYFLQLSLENREGFNAIMALWENPVVRVLTWLFAIMLAQHFFSGVRHLLLDLDIGVKKQQAVRSAKLCWLGTAIVALILGVCWW